MRISDWSSDVCSSDLTNKERMDEYQKYCGTANSIGVPFEIITPKRVKELWPLCSTEGIVGALYHPQDGHIAPVDVTNAMAIGARNGGAEIYRNTPVTALQQQPNGDWQDRTRVVQGKRLSGCVDHRGGCIITRK